MNSGRGRSPCDTGPREQRLDGIVLARWPLEENGGETLLVMSEVYPSKEALDVAGTGSADATHETFGQLDDLLAQLHA